jgi:threonylcarbamoyladenosine tRNA methylthiotransferase MtaB
VFPFSPREGTPAAGMILPDDAVASRRASLLRALSGGKDLEFRERFVGRELEAVVIERTGPGGVVLTGNAIRVELADCPAARREKVAVRITGAAAAGTTGAL